MTCSTRTRTRTTLASAFLAALVLPLSALPALAATEPVTATLAAPTGLTPDDSGQAFPHTALKTVRLDWAPVSGATSYRVEVGRDDTWSDDPVLTKDVYGSEYTLPVWLPHASYVWRVAALKGTAVGHWTSEIGKPQANASFTRGWHVAPTPIAPAGALVAWPEFSWTPVPGASAYEVQVSDTDFQTSTPTGTADTTPTPETQYQAGGKVDTCFTQRTRVTFFTEHVEHGEANSGPCYSTLLGTGDDLFWRVRALDAYTGTSKDVQTSPAAQEISVLPFAGEANGDVGSTCPGDTGGTCAPSYPSEAGNWSDSTAFSVTMGSATTVGDVVVSTLTTASDPDNVCDVVSSSPEHAVCTDFPTIRWNAVGGAKRYRVTVGLDDEFTNVQRVVDTAGLRWTPTDSWADASAGTSYYYAVQACDDTHCGPVTSTPPSFRKVTPRPTLGTKPAVRGDIVMTWKSYADVLQTASGQNESQDAYAYHVQVATSDHPSYDVVYHDITVDETRFVPSGKAYADGSYVWRVQTVDASGHKLPWSLSQAFTRDATAPTIRSVTPSSNVSTTPTLKLVFSETVTGLSSSTVTLSPAAPATLSVTGPNTATLVPTKPLMPGALYTLHVGSAVKDTSGNSAVAIGPSFRVNPVVGDSDKSVTYSSGWKVLSSTNALGGSYHGSTPTSTARTSATLHFTGTALYVNSCLGPANGYLSVYVDGVKKSQVSLYRSFSGCGIKVATVTGLTRAPHTLQVVGIGSHVSSSKGNSVALDGVTITP